MIPRDFILEWREQAPWPQDFQVEQDLIISRALVEIFSNPLLHDALAFRGGTALYKLHLKPAARYSEDIDLVQTRAEAAGPMMDALRDVLNPWLGKPQWKQTDGRITFVYRINSEDAPAVPLRLKVETNTREHFSVFGLKEIPFAVDSRWYEGSCSIHTYELDELLGTKLRALYQRKQGRDLFDLAIAEILVDTCVWLDIAKDPKQVAIVGVIEEMVKQKLIELIVPRIVLDEFRRNRDRISRDSAKSISAHIRLVKDAVDKVGGDKRRMRVVLSHLDDVNHKVPIIGGAATATLDRIEKLLTASASLDPSDNVKLRAAQRGIEKKAPFHGGKNAMADAIIIEAYAECARDKTAAGIRFAFVTHNKSDFSVVNGNQKLPHPDFASIFSRVKSLYFINLAEALRRVEPTLVSDVMLEQSWTEEPRGLTEILEAEDLLFHQVWYNRHWGLRSGVEDGTIKLVEKETYPRPAGAPHTVQRDVWKGALKAAEKVERKYGKENLGPWDDFEWGMVNGKLSALRWVLGDEWDMLDT